MILLDGRCYAKIPKLRGGYRYEPTGGLKAANDKWVPSGGDPKICRVETPLDVGDSATPFRRHRRSPGSRRPANRRVASCCGHSRMASVGESRRRRLRCGSVHQGCAPSSTCRAVSKISCRATSPRCCSTESSGTSTTGSDSASTLQPRGQIGLSLISSFSFQCWAVWASQYPAKMTSSIASSQNRSSSKPPNCLAIP